MINRFFKTIHNKYSTFFKFIFFLRYLFVIFFVFTAILLIIPKFFNYEKKVDIFKNYLDKNHSIIIKEYDGINFYILPVPKIEINKTNIELKQISTNLFSDKIILYPKLLSIYNYSNFKIKKLVIKNSKLNLEFIKIATFMNEVLKQKKNINFNGLDFTVKDKDIFLFNLNNVHFSNYGSNKNKFIGKIFNKKFSLEFDEGSKLINIKVPGIGLQTKIKYDDKINDYVKGNSEIKILNTNLKFNFLFSNKEFRISNSYFRSKDLSFRNNGSIIFNPYFFFQSNFTIEDVDLRIFKKLDFKKFSNSKSFLKKINIKNEINYQPKKFNKSFIKRLDLKINLAYGRLNFKKILISEDGIFKCFGSANLIEEFPVLEFDCNIFSKDKKKFLKLFSINYKNKGEIFETNIQGYINLIKRKINFKKISSYKYNASKEDLLYFKNQFEEILLNENLIDNFNLKNIKKFILEIS
jgi:hypothetical protein